MALTEYTTIGGGLVDADRDALRRYFLLKQRTASKKRTIYRRGEKAILPSYSLLTQVADAWNALSDAVKDDWHDAGAEIGLGGYNLYVQDKSYRIIHSLAGNATPSLNHQYLVGFLTIPEGAGDTKFKQSNIDVLTFPATFYISAKTALSGDPVNGEYLKVRFVYEYDEGGGLTEESTEISLPLIADWTKYSQALAVHTGLTGVWRMEIESHAVKGDFYFDNIYVLGAGGIITKDPTCLKVSNRWQLLLSPAGASLLSEYPI